MKNLMPWRRTERPELRNRFERVLDQVFSDPWGNAWLPEAAGNGRRDVLFAPSVEVTENESHLIVRAELPGVDPNDVNVELMDNVLVISGRREEKREEKEGDRTFSEFVFGSFRREIALPSDVDPDSVKATFEKGILTIELQKSPASKARKINIESK